MTPAAVPIIGEAQIGTNPAQGVIVAKPAIEPVNNPINFGFLSLIHSTNNHDIVANDAAISVFKNAREVILST